MKARDLANVALKVLGIYWFVQAIVLLLQGSTLPFMGLQNVQGFNWKLEATSLALFIALYVIVSYFLMFRTHSVMRLIAIDEDAAVPAASNPQPGYAPLAFSLLGAFFAIPAAGHVLSGLIKWASQWQDAGPTYGMFRQAIMLNIMPELIENAVNLIIGIILILGREKFGKLWKRLRPLAANEEEKN